MRQHRPPIVHTPFGSAVACLLSWVAGSQQRQRSGLSSLPMPQWSHPMPMPWLPPLSRVVSPLSRSRCHRGKARRAWLRQAGSGTLWLISALTERQPSSLLVVAWSVIWPALLPPALPAGSPAGRSPPHWWLRSTVQSVGRLASISLLEKTWSAPFGSRRVWWPTLTP